MALKDAILYDVNAVYGVDPVVGGEPVHARASAAYFQNKKRSHSKALVNTPRQTWASVNRGGIVDRQQVILLERATTERMGAGVDPGAWTLFGGATRAGGHPDPLGGTGAYRLEDASATESGGISWDVTLGANGGQMFAIDLKRGSGARHQLGLWDATASTWRALFSVTWSSAGVPSVELALGAGGARMIEQLVDGWYRIHFGIDGTVAANVNQMFVYAANDGGAAATGHVLVYRCQLVNGFSLHSRIVTGGATTAADEFHYTLPPPVQPVAIYLRYVHVGVAANGYLVEIGDETLGEEGLLVYGPSNSQLNFQHRNALGSSVNATLPGLPLDYGRTVEVLAIARGSAGDGLLRLAARVDNGAVAEAQAADAAFSDPFFDTAKIALAGANGGVRTNLWLADLRLFRANGFTGSWNAENYLNEARDAELDAAGN